MSIALSWYGSYLFSIDTPIARLALDSAQLAARRNGAVDYKRQKRKQKERGGC